MASKLAVNLVLEEGIVFGFDVALFSVRITVVVYKHKLKQDTSGKQNRIGRRGR